MSSHIHGQTLSRSDLAALNGGVDRTLSECVFDHADLSGLDLTGVRFKRCSFKGTDFTSAQLENTNFTSCRGAMTNFTAAGWNPHRLQVDGSGLLAIADFRDHLHRDDPGFRSPAGLLLPEADP